MSICLLDIVDKFASKRERQLKLAILTSCLHPSLSVPQKKYKKPYLNPEKD